MEWHEIHELDDIGEIKITGKQMICLSLAAMLTRISDEAVVLFLIGLYGGDAKKAIEAYSDMSSHSEVAELLDLSLEEDKLLAVGSVLMSILEAKGEQP